MNDNAADGIPELFAKYLRAKIEEGRFPKGSSLPIDDFMAVFKLKLPEVLKACFELEKLGLLRSSGNAKMEVAADIKDGKPHGLDILEDLDAIFARLAELEAKALENAWPRINRGALRELFAGDRSGSPSQRIWTMNDAIRRQIAGNCDDIGLRHGIEALSEQVDFFRHLYLNSIPQSETLEHAIAIESIVHAITACDLDAARFHIIAYIGQLEEKLKGSFRKKHQISCDGAPAAKTPSSPSAQLKEKPGSSFSTDDERNIRRLERSVIPMNFVKRKNGEWNHQDWLDFLTEIKERGYAPIDDRQVGLLLEERKAQYLASRRHSN